MKKKVLYNCLQAYFSWALSSSDFIHVVCPLFGNFFKEDLENAVKAGADTLLLVFACDPKLC